MTSQMAGSPVKIADNGDVFLTTDMFWNGVPTGRTYTRKIGKLTRGNVRPYSWVAIRGKTRKVGGRQFRTRREAIAWLIESK